MVLVDGLGDRPREIDIPENRVVGFGVHVDHMQFGLKECCRTHENFRRYVDLAYIVDDCGEGYSLDHCFLAAQFLANRDCQLRNSPLMARCVGIAEFHGRRSQAGPVLLPVAVSVDGPPQVRYAMNSAALRGDFFKCNRKLPA